MLCHSMLRPHRSFKGNHLTKLPNNLFDENFVNLVYLVCFHRVHVVCGCLCARACLGAVWHCEHLFGPCL